MATTGDGYALHCSDEGVAAAVVAAIEAAAVDTRRDGAVVIAGAMQPRVA